MGYSLYCFHQDKNILISKSNLYVPNDEKYSENEIKDSKNYKYSSNNRSTSLSENNNIIENLLPNIVILKLKKVK